MVEVNFETEVEVEVETETEIKVLPLWRRIEREENSE